MWPDWAIFERSCWHIIFKKEPKCLSTFGVSWKHNFLSKNWLSYFWGLLFYSSIWSHWYLPIRLPPQPYLGMTTKPCWWGEILRPLLTLIKIQSGTWSSFKRSIKFETSFRKNVIPSFSTVWSDVKIQKKFIFPKSCSKRSHSSFSYLKSNCF